MVDLSLVKELCDVLETIDENNLQKNQKVLQSLENWCKKFDLISIKLFFLSSTLKSELSFLASLPDLILNI